MALTVRANCQRPGRKDSTWPHCGQRYVCSARMPSRMWWKLPRNLAARPVPPLADRNRMLAGTTPAGGVRRNEKSMPQFAETFKSLCRGGMGKAAVSELLAREQHEPAVDQHVAKVLTQRQATCVRGKELERAGTEAQGREQRR